MFCRNGRVAPVASTSLRVRDAVHGCMPRCERPAHRGLVLALCITLVKCKPIRQIPSDKLDIAVNNCAWAP